MQIKVFRGLDQICPVADFLADLIQFSRIGTALSTYYYHNVRLRSDFPGFGLPLTRSITDSIVNSDIILSLLQNIN